MFSAIAVAAALWSVAVASLTTGVVAPSSSFDHHGRVATIGGLAWPSGQERTAVTGTGDIYVAAVPGPRGGPGTVLVRRYLPDGQPDRGFGLAGTVIGTELGDNFRLDGLMVDTDGLPYLVGTTDDDGLIVARLDPAGALDPSYGEDGIARLGPHPTGADRPRATIDQENRMIVAAGGTVDRLDPSGKLDPTFGTDGMVQLPSPEVEGLGVDGEGRVQATLRGDHDTGFRLMRLEEDGRPSPSLGATGIRTFKGIGTARAMAVRTDGSTLVVGTGSRHRAGGTTVPLLSIGSRGIHGRVRHSTAYLRGAALVTNVLSDPNGDDYLIGDREVVDLDTRSVLPQGPRGEHMGGLLDSFGEDGRVVVSRSVGRIARGATITDSGETILIDGIADPRASGAAHGFLAKFPAAEHVIYYEPEPPR